MFSSIVFLYFFILFSCSVIHPIKQLHIWRHNRKPWYHTFWWFIIIQGVSLDTTGEKNVNIIHIYFVFEMVSNLNRESKKTPWIKQLIIFGIVTQQLCNIVQYVHVRGEVFPELHYQIVWGPLYTVSKSMFSGNVVSKHSLHKLSTRDGPDI